MLEITRVKRLDEIFSPNLLAVVNFPENRVPTRGYIFDSHIDNIYGSLEKAIDYFVKRSAFHTVNKETFLLIGFLFGKKENKDIFYYPWEYSRNGEDPVNKNNKIRSQPELVKNWQFMGWPIREKEDFWYILTAESKHRRKCLLESPSEELPKKFIYTLPEIEAIEYL